MNSLANVLQRTNSIHTSFFTDLLSVRVDILLYKWWGRLLILFI